MTTVYQGVPDLELSLSVVSVVARPATRVTSDEVTVNTAKNEGGIGWSKD